MKTRMSFIAVLLLVAGCGEPDAAHPFVVMAPTDYAQDGLRKVCGTSTAQLTGIDVSKYQQSIDWDAVAGDGVVFGFARASDGLYYDDWRFETNWQQMQRVGIIRGTYQFFRASQDPIAQADLMLDKLTAAGGLTADDLPPVLDIETNNGMSNAVLIDRATIWLDYVEQQIGRQPIVYTAAFMSTSLGSALSAYPLWVANYTGDTNACPWMPDGWNTWTFWQYTSHGSVSGVTGDVDTDVFDGDLDALHAFIGSTPPVQQPPAGDDVFYRLPLETDSGASVWSSGHVDYQTPDDRYIAGIKDYTCGARAYEGHRGTDFNQWRGAWLVAAAPGTVLSVHDGCRDDCYGPWNQLPASCKQCGGTFGNHVYIEHADGTVTLYAHMILGSLQVGAGDWVDCGERLGQMGSSGYSSGNHLHFQAWHPSWVMFDPYAGNCQTGMDPPATRWVAQNGYDTVPSPTCQDGSSPPQPVYDGCFSHSFNRQVNHGDCVQVLYAACGESTCAWYGCNDGAWLCTDVADCTTTNYAQPTCEPVVGPTCGDGNCDAGEDCGNCAGDCGSCLPVCGNGVCESGEDCGNCAGDCGSCLPVCGNGVCESGEDCGNCATDCGSCSCPSGDGMYCGASVGLAADTLYSCQAGTFSVSQVCSSGCTVAAPGHADSCAASVTPQNLSPSGGQTLTTSSVTLSWDPLGGANSYEVGIEFWNNGAWAYYYTYSASASSKTFWPQTHNTSYRWHVRANTGGSWTDWSGFAEFYFAP